jgi:hypothetical protein
VGENNGLGTRAQHRLDGLQPAAHRAQSYE